MMNKINALVCAVVLLTGSLFAGIGDTLISFGTKGPDTYSDGQTVLDGECYALVWTKDGCVFGGFNTDGSLVSEFDKVVVFAPVAEGGRCPTTLFQIDENKVSKENYSKGSFSIYLLDTRVSRNGLSMPAGLVNGAPRFISGYSPVIGTVKANGTFLSIGTASVKASSATRDGTAARTADSAATRNCANICAAVPSDLDQPKITSIKVQGGNVILTVENLPGFIGVRGSETISDFGPCGNAVEADGTAKPVTITLPANEGGAFFKAFRSR